MMAAPSVRNLGAFDFPVPAETPERQHGLGEKRKLNGVVLGVGQDFQVLGVDPETDLEERIAAGSAINLENLDGGNITPRPTLDGTRGRTGGTRVELDTTARVDRGWLGAEKLEHEPTS
ncbi:hypothetical protein [Thiocystis violacea]|uniref:hypothetical protein n=1 Tax=Thiocystis violacea TaxID=13725 RepID=UPI0019075922|nr:hypothetical protein [Thiocystis violacea]